MALFHVFLHGEHFLIHKDGADAWMGFYKNFYVEADNADQAEQAAIRRLTGDPGFRAMVRNPPDQPPELNIEETTEIAPGHSLKDSDFVFFPEEA
jgi:hypothetical protein